MRKLLLFLLSILLMVSIFVSCGAKDNGQNESQNSDESQVKEEIVEEEVPETQFTEQQTEMGNYMNDLYAYIENGWIYTIGWGADTAKPLFLKMREDSSDDTVLRYYEDPSYITVKGEYIYSALRDSDNKCNIYRYRLGGDDEKKLIDNAYYMQIVDDSIYYCKCENSNKMINFCRSDLKGKNEEVLLDKEIYYPFVVGDDLYYQDDKDNETIHKYSFVDKTDTKITQEKTYGYILNDDYMYCLLNDGSTDDDDYEGTIAKVDLNTLETINLYEGAEVLGFNIKDDKIYFINSNDECRIYSIDKNGENIAIVSQDNYCWGPLIFGDKIIYVDSAYDYEHIDNIYICNLDGSDKKSIKKTY